MSQRFQRIVTAALFGLALISMGCRKDSIREQQKNRTRIVTSDTLLSGMCETLLPSGNFEITAILPPGQCPGHYDVTLTDIAKVQDAGLVISFLGMPFMNQTEVAADRHLLIDTKGRNWMTPPCYIAGLGILADRLIERFPEQRQPILARKEQGMRYAEEKLRSCTNSLQLAAISQNAVIASSMLKDPLEWMGFRVIGAYGRPESLSAKEIVELTRMGREKRAVMIVDNLQSGPDAGKGIAEALKIPHVIFSNFPSEDGYFATLNDNINAALAVRRIRR